VTRTSFDLDVSKQSRMEILVGRRTGVTFVTTGEVITEPVPRNPRFLAPCSCASSVQSAAPVAYRDSVGSSERGFVRALS